MLDFSLLLLYILVNVKNNIRLQNNSVFCKIFQFFLNKFYCFQNCSISKVNTLFIYTIMKTLEELTTDFLAKKISKQDFEEKATILLQPFSEELCFVQLLGLEKKESGKILYTDDKENSIGSLKDDAIYLSLESHFIIGRGSNVKMTQLLPKTVNDFINQIKNSGLDIPFI